MYQNLNLFIGGDWRAASDKATKPVTDPASEEVLGTIAVATSEDIVSALSAAKDGFEVWRKTGTWERAAKIRKVADLIRERQSQIAHLMSMETGKPLAESMGETGAAADQFEWHSEETKRIYGQVIESRTSDSRMAVIYQPVGVVAAFSADAKGMHIRCRALSRKLGVPVVPTVAHMGHGIAQLFQIAADTVRKQVCPLLQAASQHICDELQPLSQFLSRTEVNDAFHTPHSFLLMQIAASDDYFVGEMEQHFPALIPELKNILVNVEQAMPRGLSEELHADRHHRAASLFESVTRLGSPHEGGGWRYWLDELFLHPQWGLLGSLAVFAMVLFVVFGISTWLDSISAALLIDWVAEWQPQTAGGVIGRAVVDGVIGLVGIVVPYMLPLVLLLVALEDSGIMHRIAFVVDRGFHRIGLHGGVAVPFLLGLGCNVPAISSAARVTNGRERVIASVLITFVPCSARSAVILALAGKYLGGFGVFGIFMLTILVIGIVGPLLTRRFPERSPGQVQEIPAYAMPGLSSLLRESWMRTRDILTIVTPLLVGGSVVLALLSYIGADAVLNTMLIPVTSWWLGVPVVLGVPILFGILRKELSLLMIYQALGSFDVGAYMDWVQLTTFLLFLTFYIPCVSTFAVMLKTIGRKQALFSVFLSVAVALLVSGSIRLLLEVSRFIATG